ncbi:MAG: type II secretion system protein GspL [bacterium]
MIYFQQSLGIDIRDNNLCVAHLGMSYRGVELINGIVETLPYNTDEFPRESEIKIVEILREFVRGYHEKLDDVIIGIPRKKIFFREISLPAVEKENLREMLSYELENHIPMSIDDVYFDYHVAGKGDENSLRIFLVAVKRDTLTWYLDILNKVDLSPTIIEMSSFALYNLIRFNNILNEKVLGASIEINKNNIEISIIEDQELKFSRAINRVDEGLEKWFFDEGLMKAVSEDPPNPNNQSQTTNVQVNSATKTLVNDITFELIHTIENGKLVLKKELTHIALCGLEWIDENLAAYLSQKAEVSAVVVDPTANISCENGGLKGRVALASAIGLALRGIKEQPISINLLPIGLKTKKRKNLFITTIVMFCICIFLIVSTLGVKTLRDDRELKLINEEIAKLEPEIVQVIQLEKEYEERSKEVEGLIQLEGGKILKVDILRELTARIPENTWLHRLNFSVKDNKIEISGYAESGSERLIQALEDSELFENVSFIRPVVTRKIKEESREEFSIQTFLEGTAKKEEKKVEKEKTKKPKR